MKNRILIAATLLAGLFLLSYCKSKKEGETDLLHVYSIALNKVSPYYEGQWQGIKLASDGACYFGSSSHGLAHGGGFFRFDPSTKQFDVLTEDFTKITNTDLSKYTPQGKCHSPIIDINGVLYLATHIAAYWKPVLDKYEGSHILSYNMKEKVWHDFGIIKPRYSTYSAIEVDTARGKFYAMVVPFALQDKAVDGPHLYQIDMKTFEKRDLGRLDDGHGSFWFYLDNTGKVWVPVWMGTGRLHCYDPVKDTLMTFENPIPDPLLAPDGKPALNAMSKTFCWTWGTPVEGKKRFLFTTGDRGGGDERLWYFDPAKFDPKNPGSKEAFTPVCYVGNTFLSVALGGNRVYYIQDADNAQSRNYNPELHRDDKADSVGKPKIHMLHLKSVALDPNDKHPFIDHGQIIDQDGRTPAYCASLAADDKGNIFMEAGFFTKPGDQPTKKFIFEAKPGEDQYQTLNRGEFFAWVNVSKQLK